MMFLLQTPTKRKSPNHDSGGIFIPETPSSSISPPIFSPSPDSVRSTDLIIEQLFNEGVAHELQWTSFTKSIYTETDQMIILNALQQRFSKQLSLEQQLPNERISALHPSFYDPSQNWFYQLFTSHGYDAMSVAGVFNKWLKGKCNSIVLCGGRLSSAKLLFDLLAQIFPTSIVVSDLNSLIDICTSAPFTPLICIPYALNTPSPLVLHLMEGNATHSLIDGTLRFFPKTAFLIHCADIGLAHQFVGRNTAAFFMPDPPPVDLSPCPHPRLELRTFSTHFSSTCLMSLHCKTDTPLCSVCISKSQ